MVSTELPWSTRIRLTSKFFILAWMINGMYLVGISIDEISISKNQGRSVCGDFGG